MIGQHVTQSATESWREAIALLVEAATRGYREAETDGALHSTALWAHGVALAALELLPSEQDHLLEDVVLDESCAELDMVGLIRAAETMTRRHPIEQFPVGASGVIVDLLDLVRESRSD